MKVGEVWKPRDKTKDWVYDNHEWYVTNFVDPQYGVDRDLSRVRITSLFSEDTEYVTYDFLDTEGFSGMQRKLFLEKYERVYEQ